MLIAQHAGGSVFTFQRRGHFVRTQPDKSKEIAPKKPKVLDGSVK